MKLSHITEYQKGLFRRIISAASLLNKSVLIALLLPLTAGCSVMMDVASTLSCNEGPGRFVITSWHEGTPRQIAIYQYKKGSGFSVLEKSYDNSSLTAKVLDSDSLYIRQVANGQFFPYNADYIVKINEAYVYRIDSIKSRMVAAHCVVTEGRVNNHCEIDSSEYGFDASCAIPAHDEPNMAVPQ